MASDNMTRTHNGAIVSIAALTAIGLNQENNIIFYAAAIVMISIIIMALVSPWKGLLALFPLVFSLSPAPEKIGLQELFFATLLLVINVSSFASFSRSASKRLLWKAWGLPLLAGTIALTANLAVAMSNNILLVDWVRGAVPFLFLLCFLPIATLLENDRDKIQWLGTSVATLIVLLSGYIVFYYFHYDIWQPYWLLVDEHQTIKITHAAALENPAAIGPMRDRITLLVAQATDALLPVGLVAGVILTSLAHKKCAVVVGFLMALTCLAAILITFTRSMLMSALLAILVFSALVIFFQKKSILKLLATLIFLGGSGTTFIHLTGMQDIWVSRINQLTLLPTSPPPSLATEPLASDEAPYAPEPIQPQDVPLIATLAEAPVDATTELPESTEAAQEQKAEQNTGKDFNISSRIAEYYIAWEMFMAHPILGNGLGIKHEMQWEISEEVSSTEFVAYVHNWPSYMLMVGGLSAMFGYSALLLCPVFFRFKNIGSEPIHFTLIRMAILTMAVYGLFFAVFRLISFNLLIAAFWGVIFTQVLSGWQKNERRSNETKGLG